MFSFQILADSRPEKACVLKAGVAVEDIFETRMIRAAAINLGKERGSLEKALPKRPVAELVALINKCVAYD